jgi:hypothetical protein
MAWKDAAARHRRAEVRNLRKIFLHFPQKIYGLDASATVTFNQLSVLSATRRFRHFELSKATADPSSLRSAGMTVCGEELRYRSGMRSLAVSWQLGSDADALSVRFRGNSSADFWRCYRRSRNFRIAGDTTEAHQEQRTRIESEFYNFDSTNDVESAVPARA